MTRIARRRGGLPVGGARLLHDDDGGDIAIRHALHRFGYCRLLLGRQRQVMTRIRRRVGLPLGSALLHDDDGDIAILHALHRFGYRRLLLGRQRGVT
ncbi:MAG: hypothetical protein ABSG76_16510, partial [Xanthobacteraceae bacterium]